jgi:hypothetical protein
MRDAPSFPVKKAFLYALVGSVALSAILGILAILSGDFGWLELRILLTTVTIAVASIAGLACGAYLATRRGRTLPLAGAALSVLAAVMIIAGMWLEDLGSELYWKIAASASVFAVACAHLSLLSMARLAEWFRWSLAAAHAVILAVAALFVVIIFTEGDREGMFQLLAVAAVLDAAITVVIPILHRLSKADTAPMKDGATPAARRRESIDAEIARLKARIAELERLKEEGG